MKTRMHTWLGVGMGVVVVVLMLLACCGFTAAGMLGYDVEAPPTPLLWWTVMVGFLYCLDYLCHKRPDTIPDDDQTTD